MVDFVFNIEKRLLNILRCIFLLKLSGLPSVARHQGTCLVAPGGNAFLKTLFNTLGGCVECESERLMRTMMVTTGLMGPMYGILKTNRDWLIAQGVPPEDASYFVGRTYMSIIQDAEYNCRDPCRFDDLIEEQTPGGLNEQALKNLESRGLSDAYRAAMDAMLSRLEGSSDGFLPTKDSV